LRLGSIGMFTRNCKWEGGEGLTSYSTSELTLFPVKKSGSGPLDYICDPENTLAFPGAHGEEIVRDLFTDVHVRAPCRKFN
jgi:hypothetical protein